MGVTLVPDAGFWAYGGEDSDGGLFDELVADRALSDGAGGLVDDWSVMTITGTRPPPLVLPGLVYDPPRNVLMLFGGQLRDGGLSGETWEYSLPQNQWTKRAP